jgi:MFS family permease
MTTWFSATAALPALRNAWSLSDSASAWLTIAVQVGFVAGALTSAALTLSDILPPRRMILFGAIGAAGANALLLAVDGPGLAIPLRLATGFFLAGVYPRAQVHGDVVPRRSRNRTRHLGRGSDPRLGRRT